jgi:hypothetical protein
MLLVDGLIESARSLSMRRALSVQRELSVSWLASSNVEVTGAARLYRAASSDRRERGRPQCYAAWFTTAATNGHAALQRASSLPRDGDFCPCSKLHRTW